MRIKNTVIYILICWIFIGIFTADVPPCFSAQTAASLNQQLNQTNRKRNQIQQKKKQADLRLRYEKNKLSANQQRLEAAHEKLQANTVRYNNLAANLVSMERNLNVAIEDFRRTDAAMKSRIRDVFKHQRFGMFELILSAQDVNSLLDIVHFEKIVIEKDYQRMKALKARADEIARLKAQVENQKRMLEASIRDINYQRVTIQNSIQSNKNMIERLNKDKNYYEKMEEELARQSSSIQNMIASLAKKTSQSGAQQIKVSSTGFMRPISGPITSPFGYRIHPIFKTRIFHSGIDIGGPNGGAIKASNDGKVIYSGWYGGYGKVVILDHGVINGKPITTLYAHMSSILVSNGQFVKKGQTVGKEGSTGYSTGPHCHFEVRVNGKPVNPLSYI